MKRRHPLLDSPEVRAKRANMRHLWLLEAAPAQALTKKTLH